MFFWGLLVGVLLAIPVGPSFVLCIRYSFLGLFLCALFAGVGSAFADGIYALFVAYGLHAIGDFMEKWSFYLHALGSIILIVLGIRSFIPEKEPSENLIQKEHRAKHVFYLTFFLTLTSPLTFLGVSGVSSAFDLDKLYTSGLSPWYFSLGVIVGGSLFWLFISMILYQCKKRTSQNAARKISQAGGAVLFLLGVSLLFYALFFIKNK